MKGPQHASDLPLDHRLRGCPVEPKRDLPIPAVNWHLPEEEVVAEDLNKDDLTVSWDDPRGFVKFDAIYAPSVFTLARDKRCALCKGELTVAVFIGGESTLKNGRYNDGPMHGECALASLTLCPHLRLIRHRRTSETRQMQAEGTLHIENDGVRGDQYVVIAKGYKIDIQPGYMSIVVPFEARIGVEQFTYRNGEIERVGSMGMCLAQLPEGY